MILTITAEQGAAHDGVDFFETVREAVEDERSNVYIVVAGEYGHLYIESIEGMVEE